MSAPGDLRRFAEVRQGVVVAVCESSTWMDEWVRADETPLAPGLIDVTAITADHGELEALLGQRRTTAGTFEPVPRVTEPDTWRTRVQRKADAIIAILRS